MKKNSIDLIGHDHVTSIRRAILKSRELFARTNAPCADIELHELKSILYAIVERLGMKAERFYSMQRLFRELLGICMCAYDFKPHEKNAALYLLDELERLIHT